jgi:hypothetical protein
MDTAMKLTLLVVTVAALTVGVSARGQERRINADALTIADFNDRVYGYAALSKKLDETIKEPSSDSQPQAFLDHQRALAKLIQKARAGAKPGDLCRKPMREIIRKLVAGVVRGPGGKEIRRSLLDEYPGNLRLAVNSEYPDNAPLSTVPPQILQGLPKLPERLEYRFLGKRLLLIDSHARIVADIVEKVVP